MSANELYRVEVRVRNGLKRYYLVREVNTDAKKFAATRIIKSGTKPTKAEISRTIALFGFDLEMKCMNKVAKFRAGKFTFEQYADDNEYYELEKFRYLLARLPPENPELESAAYISAAARTAAVDFTPAEVSRLLSAGEIPRGKRLYDVNVVQNLHNAYRLHGKKERLTPKTVYRLQNILYQNIDAAPLTSQSKKDLAALISSFNQKIKENAHPFEQCFLFYEAFSDHFPEAGLLGFELFSKMTAGFGYRIPVGSWPEMTAWAKNRNADMEFAVRRSFEEMTKGKIGVRQKQLDFFS